MVDFDEDGRIILPGNTKSEVATPKEPSKKACWSLFKKTNEDNPDDPNIFNSEGKKLQPLRFSNGKTQEDVIKEVLDAYAKGENLIFIKGVCGSGKSAIALNLAKHFKKTSIVVPIKSLQDQYESDYTDKNYILKEDGKKLHISVIKGRGNFICPYEKEHTADYEYLPCTIELREKNMQRILDMIEENKEVKKEDFSSVSDVRRVSVAAACPYWSPLMPADASAKALSKARKRKYQCIKDKDYAFFERAKGCGYYQQYHNYIDSDVLIFNAQKYLLEVAVGRKPKTDLDVIDECDEFLDSFANEKKINLNRLITALSTLVPEEPKDKHAIKELILLANKTISFYNEDIEKLEKSPAYDLFKKIIDYPYLAEDEDRNYYNSVFESVKSFENLVEETYIIFEKPQQEQRGLFAEKNGETVFMNLVSVNIGRRFKDLIDNNELTVLMSGTLHSEGVLRDIFGLEKFKIIEAETEFPGSISRIRTKLEMNCKYENFKSGICSRKDYLLALDACVKKSKKPTLIHVSSFADMPSDIEMEQLNLQNLISKEKMFQLQEQKGLVKSFKTGDIDLLFSTKCARGVDFPGEECNSIIITKYPYPNIQGLFWKILKKEKPEKFMEFYMDKAKRELVQKISRGIRFKGDHVLLFSPDSRVLDARID
jgi:Rad3-related DNA helicase